MLNSGVVVHIFLAMLAACLFSYDLFYLYSFNMFCVTCSSTVPRSAQTLRHIKTPPVATRLNLCVCLKISVTSKTLMCAVRMLSEKSLSLLL